MADREEQMPNIIVWSWMSSALHLKGTELIIFAYIYNVSFDSIHRCYTTLASMEQWFGMTRQAVSRRIQNLVDSGYLTKQTNVENSGFVKHNSYSVNMANVTEACEASDFDTYKNFIDSYGSVLKSRFPNDAMKIDDYLETLIQWHRTKDVRVTLTMKEISDILLSDDVSDSISDIVGIVAQYKKPKPITKSSFVEKSAPKISRSLFDVQSKPKRNSKAALKKQWQDENRKMTVDFVVHNLGGNEEIISAVNRFLETDAGKNYTPDQWRQQLNNMYEYGITEDRILSGVNTSYMNGYKSLYVRDRNESDMRKKMKMIEDYVSSECENNTEIKELLLSYLFEVPKARSYSANQFKLILKDLSDLCPTIQDKIASVIYSYTHGYSALAYKASTSQDVSDTVDIDEKHEAVENFIKSGYYYLTDGLAESLHTYIDTTQNGKSMSVDAFRIALENLRLYCLNDSDKVAKVKLAIQNDYKYFATEDYAETRKLRAKQEDRESAAHSADHFRMSRIFAELNSNPNNPKLVGVEVGDLF